MTFVLFITANVAKIMMWDSLANIQSRAIGAQFGWSDVHTENQGGDLKNTGNEAIETSQRECRRPG